MEVAIGRLHFSFLRCVASDEEVRVVGSSPELGSWDPAAGVSLIRTGQMTWSVAASVAVPAGERLEYKYVFVYGLHTVWEFLEVNRSVTTTPGLLHIEDLENSLISKQYLTPPTQVPASPPTTQYDVFQSVVSFNPSEDIINLASMILPVQVARNPDHIPGDQSSEKWLFSTTSGLWMPTLYDLSQEHMKFRWFGHPGFWPENDEEQTEIANVLMTRFSCVPIFLAPSLLNSHLDFCSDVLFPIFHNIIHTDPEELPQYSGERWEAYRQVNSKYAEKIAEMMPSNSLVWVNDYQLLLLPSFLSRRAKEPTNIGLYFHTPFPSSEVYKILPHREALLHSMLCCDILGFHLFEYARHFLTSCKRLLGGEHSCSQGGYLGVEFYGRQIMVWVGHLGVEPRLLLERYNRFGGQDIFAECNVRYKGKVLLLGIDPLQTFSGIALKLSTFKELFLELTPTMQEKVEMLQILTPPRHNNVGKTDLHRRELEDMVRAINEELGRNVITLLEKNLTRGERLGYLKAATGLIVTSIRDGLNLLPLEFIIIKSGEVSSVVLSEFAGVSRAITSPFRVNPFNTSELKEAMYQAITVGSISPKVVRDEIYISEHSTKHWAFNFLSDLKKAKKDPTKFQYVLSGTGDRMKLLALGRDYCYLDSYRLAERYRSARNRVFFFDSEGTISDRLYVDCRPAAHYERNLHILESLLMDDRNTIFIVSGRQRSLLERYYDSIPMLGLVAEDGALLRMTERQGWELLPDLRGQWKALAEDVIMSYAGRTEGAVCEVKDTSVVFQYRDADPEYGDWQAKELVAQLEMVLGSYVGVCEVGSGKGYVEVKPSGVNKGSALRLITSRITAKKGEIDFLMAVGDDVNDEAMFKEVKVMKEKGELARSYTISIGKKPTIAKFYLNDSSELTNVLETLHHTSVKVGRFYSHSNLRSLDVENRLSGSSQRKIIEVQEDNHEEA